MTQYNGSYTMKRLGNTVCLTRKKNGLKQKELAQKAGISVGSMNRYEKGLKVAKLSTLEKIAAAMNMRIEVSFVEDERA